MKSFLIIGMGNFGHYLCQELLKYNCEIMIIDETEERLEDMLPFVASAKVGDCTNPEVLGSLGVKNFDACFVCIGDRSYLFLRLRRIGDYYVHRNLDIQGMRKTMHFKKSHIKTTFCFYLFYYSIKFV